MLGAEDCPDADDEDVDGVHRSVDCELQEELVVRLRDSTAHPRTIMILHKVSVTKYAESERRTYLRTQRCSSPE
jgi:hypothetical protein